MVADGSGSRSLLRDHTTNGRVTNVELFFDLVYVFAVTQLSHLLLTHPTVTGAAQTALLLALVWLAWVYTTWVTNFLDPGPLPTRVMLLVVMLGSLVMSTGLPEAFGSRGLVVGIAYAAMQVLRTAYAAVASRDSPALQRNFERILCWCCVSGALAVAGGLAQGWARAALWTAAVAVDVAGGWAGFWTPGLGRSTTDDWTIEGNHFAERCAAFVLIALGESVVLVGATLAGLPEVGAGQVAALLACFVGTVGLWWLYFDRSADDAAQVIASSADPGRLGRSAYHLVHPVMVAGIIVVAAADERVLAEPGRHADGPTGWLVLGGFALFLLGHALFKATVWHAAALSRTVAALLLLATIPLAPRVPAVALEALAAAVVVVVAVLDRTSRWERAQRAVPTPR